jgi:hypothetical protein
MIEDVALEAVARIREGHYLRVETLEKGMTDEGEKLVLITIGVADETLENLNLQLHHSTQLMSNTQLLS